MTAKIEWYSDDLFQRVGFIVRDMPMEPDWVMRSFNRHCTVEQCIKNRKFAFRWSRLSVKRFRNNDVRLQLHAIAYNLAAFRRCIDLPEAMAD